MSLSDYYDAIFAGGSLSSYLCAALLAKAGKKTLVIDETSHVSARIEDGVLFDPDFATLGGCDQYVFGRCLQELNLGISGPASHDLLKQEVLTQVLTPRFRILFGTDPDVTFRELRREFYVDHKKIEEFFSLLYRAGNEVSSFIEGALTLGQSSDSEQGKWKKFWGSFYPSLNSETPVWLHKVLSPEAASACETLGSALLGAFTYSTPQNIGFEQLVRSLSLLFQGQHQYRGGLAALKSKLGEMIKASGGNVKTNAIVESLVVDRKRIVGVHLSSYEGICRADVIVVSSKHRKLYLTLPEGFRDQSVTRSLNRLLPSHWRFTISITVRREVLPVGASSSMTYVGSEKLPLEEANFLRIQTVPAEHSGASAADYVTMLVTALVPYRSSAMDYRYLRQLSGKILHALCGIMPFLEFNIIKIFPDFRPGEDQLREQYPFKGPEWIPEDLLQYYVRGHKAVQDFWGPSWTTPHLNVYFSGRAIWPALGTYGEALTARKIYEDLMRGST